MGSTVVAGNGSWEQSCKSTPRVAVRRGFRLGAIGFNLAYQRGFIQLLILQSSLEKAQNRKLNHQMGTMTFQSTTGATTT
jgi:hypothetical protein